MSKQSKSMGDLFLQQRRERAASSAPSSNLTLLSSTSGANSTASSPSNSAAKPKSFAEIQRVQQQEKTRGSRVGNNTTNPSRGGNTNTNRRASRDINNTQQQPIEQGIIHTLLDKFGFIHCADRPSELFFHYTSTKHSWDDLNIGDEVQFRVGTGGGGGRSSNDNADKLKAFDVVVLPKNSIVWETEDEVDKRYKGKVKSVPREGSREKAVCGVIQAEDESTTTISFTNSDCKIRLGKGDIVEYSMFTERRTNAKLARDVTLIQSERERQRLEREAKLLEGATLEMGEVVRIPGNSREYGFISSVNRVEEVYFHVSHVENGEMLVEGTEIEFYVVDESLLDGNSGRKKSGKSLCARKIKVLPAGTVKFEHVLAEGVTGVVLECPVEKGAEGFGPRGGGSKKNVMGKIRLDVPVKEVGKDDNVTEVILHPDLYPGGMYAMNRVGSEMGLWIRPGDVLLFDVVHTIRDGKCKAVPTKYTQIPSLRTEGSNPDDSIKPAVRLVELALMGRSEGVVGSIRDDYAFIHCAERKVDAYMKLYEIFPNELYSDLMQNTPELDSNLDNETQERGRIRLEVGMEVSFDLSVQMISNHMGGRGGGRNMRSPPEKESLRARRVQILPKGSVKEKIPVATGVKASVLKEDKRQQFVGTLELEEPVIVPTSSRYPYIAKLLDYVAAGRYGSEVVFNEVISEKDAQAVMTMVNARDDLELTYVPLDCEGTGDGAQRKICIAKREKVSADASSEKDGEEESGEKSTPSVDKDVSIAESSVMETSSAAEKDKKNKGEKLIKNIRSFPDTGTGPLGVGDVITCDLFLSRSSGQVYGENIEVIERKERPVAEEEQGGKESTGDKKDMTGYVTEVVPARQFGFITGIDENGSKTGDHVFFHYKTVNSTDDIPQDASPTKKYIKTDIIRKGDEVKFDAEPGKNGKLTATSITILPRGTLKMPSKVDKSAACTGYVLLEPSHTSLANTPSHMVVHSGPSLDGVGRWDNVGKEPKSVNASGSNIKEEGVILLLSDPSHLFSQKPPSERKSSVDESDSEVKSQNESSKEPTCESAVGTHVRYKTSSLAYRFSTDNPDRPEGPKRGDLVVFGKAKGAKLVKDIRIEKLEAATTNKGTLVDINLDDNMATFVSDDGTNYSISLSEVVSCEKSLLKENQEVNGVLHDGKIFGVCRTKDIFLTSSLSKMSIGSNGPKQRPKLNLTVKKELQGLGGQIMAQSKMAKGPDGTNGFVQGWTKRLSPYVKTFIPAHIPDSGFDASSHEENNAN